MEEYKRFTVSLPKDLYEKFESFREKLGISRSDGIRKAMQSLMISEENIPKTSGNVVGCISIIMGHEHFQPSSEEHHHPGEKNHDQEHDHQYGSQPIYASVHQTDEILKNDIQHHFHDIIISTMHIHLEFEKCLEIIAVSGSYNRVTKLKQDLQRLRSIMSLDFFIIDKESP
ncbi:MAG: CopG family ribbon-helix-helix protein [Candidatus Lokiarchaeota archaeon]|nr:CopG family ribbon-helix-helix protein [Candidatus Lokiarchaeota archaeon]